MIDQILVMKRDSGIILYHENRTGTIPTTDPQLVAGFFAALTSFSEEVYGGHVQTLAIPGQNILFYGEEDEPILILVCNEMITPETLHPLAQRLYHRFIEKHGAESKLFPMKLRSFQGFHEEVEQELARFRPETLVPTLIAEMLPYLAYLRRMVKKGLDRAIHAIITGLSPVACVGDIGQIRVAIDALKIFGMYRTDMIAIYEREQVAYDLERLGLVGISPELREELPPNCVIVDLSRGRVAGGSPNQYSKNLLATINHGDPTTQHKEIKNHLAKLQQGVESFESLLKAKPEERQLKRWKDHWAVDEREIIYDIVQARFPVTRLLREMTKQIAPKTREAKNPQWMEIESRLFLIGEWSEEQREVLAEQLKRAARTRRGERQRPALRKRSQI